jgi:hypothetical protein
MTSPNQGLYLFEKFDVGVIHLDAQRSVLAMNDYARRVLPVSDKQPFDKLVTSFHPTRQVPAAAAVQQARRCIERFVPFASLADLTAARHLLH